MKPVAIRLGNKGQHTRYSRVSRLSVGGPLFGKVATLHKVE
jgi:hypothetical protein